MVYAERTNKGYNSSSYSTNFSVALIFSYVGRSLKFGLIQSLTGPCAAAKFWPRESRNLIGPLTIELSTEVNCLRDSLTISIRPPLPRNKSAEVTHNVSL